MRDRRAERFEATRQEILDVAWDVVRAEGLAALSMREVGQRIGMRAQSLYVYFPSKHAIYDAMFAAANRELIERRRAVGNEADPERRVRLVARQFTDFATEDPVRYQLLYQRPIPGFEPSEESYTLAREAFGMAVQALADLGVTDPADVDLYSAMVAGLVAQQNSNEPGGDRWTRQLDRVLDLFLTAVPSTDTTP
jgi:AcrR family transcriptional regulator